ncbi:hypothetical protein BS47DRAFT_1420389 [Hydnum rufescens UP504]|uniref:DUF6589 domain-containing protein n=1 Tax=Hydnum rufescens UP504 TaxID=1448309 RepID=A0A9P6B6E1_9AGAM|nr:hypothetical protein BS47DRAFT_1420389 [Hydnum rufescens UP504]
MEEQAISIVQKILMREMDVLKRVWMFRAKDVSVDYLINMDMGSYRSTLRRSAPVLWGLLVACVQSERAMDENLIKSPETLCTVVAFQLAKQHSANANLFAARFSIYLWSCGTPRAVVDILAKFGLSLSFFSIRECLDNLSKACLASTINAVRRPGVAFGMGYDNLNISTSTHAEQYLHARPKIENLTMHTIYIMKNATFVEMQASPMDVHAQRAPLLTLSDLSPKPLVIARINHQFNVQIIQILLEHPAFNHLGPDDKAAIAQYKDVRRPMVHSRTEEFPLPVAEIDESTTEGNHQNLEDMRLGDLTPYLQGTPFVGMPDYFHVMNWLLMILSVYRGSTIDDGSLATYINLLGLNRLGSAKPDHHLLERLVLQVYKGHILAAWVQISGFHAIEEFAASKPDRNLLSQLGERIAHRYIGAPSKTAFRTSADDPTTTDEIFRQCVLFNRDAAIYLELKNAIQLGDFGRVEDLIPTMICIFCGGGSPNYANELLHLLQNLKYSWLPTFADMVRDNILVNISGRHNSYMPVDMNQEHHIRLLKVCLNGHWQDGIT